MAYAWVQTISIGSSIDAVDLNEIETAANAVLNFTCASNYITVKAAHHGNNSDRSGYCGNHSYDSSDNGDRSDWTYVR